MDSYTESKKSFIENELATLIRKIDPHITKVEAVLEERDWIAGDGLDAVAVWVYFDNRNATKVNVELDNLQATAVDVIRHLFF
jgi:glutathione S-transferase